MAPHATRPPSAGANAPRTAPTPPPRSYLAAAWSKLRGRDATVATAATSSALQPPSTAAVPARGNGTPAPAPTTPPPRTHLVVLVHGLVGSASNWDVTRAALERHAPADWTILASNANARRRTFDGVDACGERLAAEVRDAVAAAGGSTTIDRISFVGHSMGGLIARHAIGLLFDKTSGTVAGVPPAHYVSLATPHLGCAHEPASPNQVPLIAWLKPPAPLAAAATDQVAKSMRRTGSHFFLTDSDPPLLLRMARDGAGASAGDPPFLSALASFATRTAYANSSRDHLVGWAGASLRHPHDLPALGATRGRGVVRDDGREAAFGGGAAAASKPVSPTTAAAADAAQAANPHALEMLDSLSALGWRRVDACFKGTRLPIAHILIQGRSWNPEGFDHVDHFVRELVAVDAEYVARRQQKQA